MRSANGCPDENTLAAFLSGELRDHEVRAVDAHVDGCEKCRSVLSSYAARQMPTDPYSETAVAPPPSDAKHRARSEPGGDEALPSARWSSAGAIAGRFEVLRKVGAGGMGKVYRARDRETGGSVAVKVMRYLGPEERSRFEREARLLAGLRHPAIVRYVASGTDADGAPFLAMAWLDGEDLAARLLRGPLDVDQSARLVLRVSEALATAHASGVIHRDIKPSNIFLVGGDVERAVVLDFGIARSEAFADGTPPTRTGALLGTVGYLAPEQARRARTADARADIFSLGSVLFECLTGKRAFPGTDTVEVLSKILTEPVPPPSASTPAVPPFLDALTERMLAKDPERRPKDCGHVAAELRSWIEGSDVTLLDPRSLDASRLPLPTVPRRRRPRAALLAGLSLGALALAGGLVFARIKKPNVAPLMATSSLTPPTVSTPDGGNAETFVLIAAIENRTADPFFDGTPAAVLALLLNQIPAVEASTGREMHGLAEDIGAPPDADGARVGELLTARGNRVALVEGVVTSKGAAFGLDLGAREPGTGRKLWTASVTAEAAQVVPTLVTFAQSLTVAIGRSVPPGGLLPGTDSLDAQHEVLVGTLLANSGSFAESISHLERAVTVAPSFAQARVLYALVLDNAGRTTEARAQLERALGEAQPMPMQERLVAEAYRGLVTGDLDGAAAAGEALVGSWPGNGHFEANLAYIYFRKRDFERAVVQQRRALERHPHNVLSRSNAANMFLVASHLDEAVSTGRSVLDGSARFPPATPLYVAVAEVLMGRRDGAQKDYARLEAVDPSSGATAAADLALFDGRLDDAETILRRAIAADQSQQKMADAAAKQAILAETRMQKGDRRGAAVATAAAAAAKEPPTLYAAAEMELAAGHVDRALSISKPPEGAALQDAELLARLVQADALRLRGKLPEALDAFDAAAKKGDSWLVHLGLGRTYLAMGDDAHALAELETCEARAGEAAMVFLDDAPTLRYLAVARRELERVRAHVRGDAASR